MGQKYSAIELCRTAQGCTVQLVQGMVKDLAPTGDAEETILAEKMVDTDEITVTMKIMAAKQVQYALLAADGTAVPLGGAQPLPRQPGPARAWPCTPAAAPKRMLPASSS